MARLDLVNLEKIGKDTASKEPFLHFCIDGFLDEKFANEIYESFPAYQEAQQLGKEFAAVNEKRKIQITDSSKFPTPILELHKIMASPEVIARVEEMTGIPNLLADPDLVGGGIHETNSGGHLDVHVDFNYIDDKDWHRRVNILIYFNKEWKEEYGGYLDIWDKEVKNRCGYFAPNFNRAAGFATGGYSWHGVTPVTCPPDMMRRSFAVYYYTKEAPAGWDGTKHSTIFKARPAEWMKGRVAMPAEKFMRGTKEMMYVVKRGIKQLLGR